METVLLTPAETARAAEIIRSGGVVAVPTETVYGLAANALDSEAVLRVFAAKGRPENKPVSIFVTGLDMARSFCREIPDFAEALAQRFWPGPLTVILKKSDNVPDEVTCGGGTVGVRVPDDATALELVRLTGLPLTGTSANLSGEPSIVEGREAFRVMNGRIDAAIDGGVCPGGEPSTIVDLTTFPPRILRPGPIPKREIVDLIEKYQERARITIEKDAGAVVK